MARAWFGDYDLLSRRFVECQQLATALDTPNEQDDEFMRIAIVGFSYHSPTQAWRYEHFEVVTAWRQGDYSDAELVPEYGGEGARRYALFASLWVGYMLGLEEAGMIDDLEYMRGEALLPGLVAGDAHRVLGG